MLKRFMREQNKELWSFDEVHSQVRVPARMLTGWYDRLIGTIDNFSGMVENGPGKPAQPAPPDRGTLGPCQRQTWSRRQGPLDFGPFADTTYAAEAVRWFDYQLKGVDDGIGSEPSVKLFVMGENRWRLEDFLAACPGQVHRALSPQRWLSQHGPGRR